jgi:hypothetical protein
MFTSPWQRQVEKFYPSPVPPSALDRDYYAQSVPEDLTGGVVYALAPTILVGLLFWFIT